MSFERADGTVRRQWTALAAAYVAFALGMIVPVGYAVVGRRVAPWIGAAAMTSYVTALIVLPWAWHRSWRLTRGRVTADARGLFVDDAPIVARAALRHAYILVDGDRTYLRLVRQTMIVRPIDVEVADEAEAQRLLTALRFDAQRSVAEFIAIDGTTKSHRRRSALVQLQSCVLFGGSLLLLLMRDELGRAFPLWPAMLLLYLLGTGRIVFAARAQQARVLVGADGVYLRRLLRAPRFISFRDLDDVTLEASDITLRLVDGSSLSVHYPGDDRGGEPAALVARIREAHAAYRAAPPSSAHRLGRGGRSTSAWIEHARSLREDSTTYRAAAVPDEQLWRIVEDAAASPAERAGAALALRRDLDDAGRARLRLAAEACAEDRLRVALETATSEDDAALALALEPLDDVPAPRTGVKARMGARMTAG